MQAKRIGHTNHRSRSQAAVDLLTNTNLTNKAIAAKVGMTTQTVSAAQAREITRLENECYG